MLDLGDEQPVTTPDGRTWQLSRLELRHIRAFRDYVAAKEEDPFALVERLLGKVADATLLPLLKEAEAKRGQLRSWSMGCPLALRHLATEEGLTFLCSRMLQQHHPDHKEEEAYAVAGEVAKRLLAILEKAMGKVPNGDGRAAPEAVPAGPTGGGWDNA